VSELLMRYAGMALLVGNYISTALFRSGRRVRRLGSMWAVISFCGWEDASFLAIDPKCLRGLNRNNHAVGQLWDFRMACNI
jgi:hypothetical protein